MTSEEKKSYSEYLKRKYPPKEEFVDRIKDLIGEDDARLFFDISYTQTPSSIRVNTLKASSGLVKKRLEDYGYTLRYPIENNPDIMIVEGALPGELGKTKEHLLGYFYIQDISSMLPILCLRPKPGEDILDLCASPGSKTTQTASLMENKGTIIANEVSMGRVNILNANLERCGVTNTIVTRKEGVALCKRLFKKSDLRFDKILLDAPCSGEGTLRKSPKTFQMWNKNMIKKLSYVQKDLARSALSLLKVGGEMVYSTCTLAPEEDEMVLTHLLENFDIKIEEISLPIRTRSGITRWGQEIFPDEIKRCVRIYPQDNDTDGFFLAKIKKLSDRRKK